MLSLLLWRAVCKQNQVYDQVGRFTSEQLLTLYLNSYNQDIYCSFDLEINVHISK